MTTPEQTPKGPEITSNDRLFAALSYLLTPIVPILVFMLEDTKSRPYPRYHAIQALGLAAAALIYEVLATIVFGIGAAVSFGLLACCLWILFFLPVVPMVYYAYLATKNTYFDIPWLTGFMIRQGWLAKP